MKFILLAAALTLLLVGCKTTDRTIRDPSGAYRPWEPAEVDWDRGYRPVSSSTEFEEHIWTGSPVPTVPPMHNEWRPD